MCLVLSWVLSLARCSAGAVLGIAGAVLGVSSSATRSEVEKRAGLSLGG